MSMQTTYASSIGGMTVLFVIMPDLVEIVFIELSNEAGEITMLEMLGKD